MLAACVLDRGAVAGAHLRPAGEPGLDAVAQVVERDVLAQFGHERRALGTRTDQAHLAAQHAEQLRQFVDAGLAHEGADRRHAAVVLRRPTRHAILLGIVAHAAELQAHEDLAAETDAFLAIEDRAGAGQVHHDGGERHHGCGQHEQDRGADDVDQALDGMAYLALLESRAVDQPAGLEAVQGHFGARALEAAGQVEHGDAADAAGEQLVHRNRAATLVAHGDDDLVDAMLEHEVDDRRRTIEDLGLAQFEGRARRLLRRGHVADDVALHRLGLVEVARHHRGVRAGAHDEDARHAQCLAQAAPGILAHEEAARQAPDRARQEQRGVVGAQRGFEDRVGEAAGDGAGGQHAPEGGREAQAHGTIKSQAGEHEDGRQRERAGERQQPVDGQQMLRADEVRRDQGRHDDGHEAQRHVDEQRRKRDVAECSEHEKHPPPPTGTGSGSEPAIPRHVDVADTNETRSVR